MRTDDHSDSVLFHPTNHAASLTCRGTEAFILGQLWFFFYGLHLKCRAEPSCYTNVFPEVSHSSKNSTILNWCFPRRVCLSEKEDPIVLSWKSWSNLLIQLDARGLRRTRRLEKVMGWLSVADTHCEPLSRDKVSSFSWHMQAPN